MNNLDKTIPLSEAFEIIDRVLCDAELPVETVPIREALGRTIVSDQVSRLELPPFN